MQEPIIELLITPDELFFQGIGPGKVHRAKLELSNKGNIPLYIPEQVEINPSDPDLISKTLLQAVREYGKEDYAATLDGFVSRLHERLEQEVQVELSKGGFELPPGKSQSIELVLRLPRKLKGITYIEGDFDLADNSVFFLITP